MTDRPCLFDTDLPPLPDKLIPLSGGIDCSFSNDEIQYCENVLVQRLLDTFENIGMELKDKHATRLRNCVGDIMSDNSHNIHKAFKIMSQAKND